MFKQSCKVLASSVVLVLALAGCEQAGEDRSEVPQTEFPGQVTAGGNTSGAVMAQNGTLKAKSERMGSPVLVPVKAAESQPPARSDTSTKGAAENTSAAGTGQQAPEGTPGIPEGAGGNVSGTEMGGTSLGAASSEQPPAPQSSGASPEAEKAKKDAEAKAKADKEKQQLDAAMNRVAQRWQANASARGWQTETADTSGSLGTLRQTQTGAIGLPTIVRSEKLGTAPASEDVKQPERDPSN